MFKTWVTPVPTGGMSKNSALLGILCYCIFCVYKYCEEHVDGCPMWLIKAIKCNAIYCNPLNYSHCTLCGYIGLCAFSLCWGTVSADIHQSSTSPPVCTDELHNKKKKKKGNLTLETICRAFGLSWVLLYGLLTGCAMITLQWAAL